MEAKIDELRAKAIASIPSPIPNPNPNPSAVPTSSLIPMSPGSREEGEISPVNDAGLATCSTAPHDNKASVEPNPSSGLKAPTRSPLAVIDYHTYSSTVNNMQQLQKPVAQNYSQQSNKKSAPYKSAKKRKFSWPEKGSNDNLVISFSDDDSESGPEDCRPKKSQGKAGATAKSTVPNTSPQSQPEGLQYAANNREKHVQKKDHAQVASIPTNAKTIGGNEKHWSSSSVERGPTIQRSSASPESESQYNANLADHRMKSLRHQIALRENELRTQLKSAFQSKESLPSLYDDQHGSCFTKRDAQTASLPGSSNTMRSTLKGQAIKRTKLDGHARTQLSGGQVQVQNPFDHSNHEVLEEVGKISGCQNDQINVSCHGSERDKYMGRQVLRMDMQDQGASISTESLHNGAKDNDSLSPVCSLTPTIRNLGMPCKIQTNSKLSAEVSYNYGPSDDRALQVASSKLTKGPCPGQMMSAREDCTPSSENILQKNSRLPGSGHSYVSREIHSSPIILDNATNKYAPERSQLTAAKIGHEMPLSMSINAVEKHAVPDPLNISREENVQLQSLMELEELYDKELEEAQELRRKCEVGERCALKAYREAQRALLDANERCTFLYRKRELVSAQARSTMMEASGSMWPLSCQSCRQTMMDFPQAAGSDMLPTVRQDAQTDCQIMRQLGYGSSTQNPDYPLVDLSQVQSKIPKFGSEQCFKPNGSPSVPKDNNTSISLDTSADYLIMSSNNDEQRFPLEKELVESRLECDISVEDDRGKPVDESSTEHRQDFERLEASLRSKLVARLGTRLSYKSNDGTKVNVVDVGDDNSDGNGKPSASFLPSLLDSKKKQTSNLQGAERPGVNRDHFPSQRYGLPHENNGTFSGQSDGDSHTDKESHIASDLGESSSFLKDSCRPPCVSFFCLPSPVLHNTSSHAKLIFPGYCNELPTRKEKTCMLHIPPGDIIEYWLGLEKGSQVYSERVTRKGDFDFQTRDPTIDSFWPFCMFELRGRCNDDKCLWQHFKNLKQSNDPAASGLDGSVGQSSTVEKSAVSFGSHYSPVKNHLRVPTYQIGFYVLKAESHLPRSILALSVWQYWQRGFSISSPFPFCIGRILPSDAPGLKSGDGHVADDTNWNRPTFYFQCPDGLLRQAMQGLTDSEQSLELALDLFEGKFYKANRKKALMLLSRAIEASPNSVVLWVVYLHIYNSKEKFLENDDMFFHSVQLNKHSYELWLMYINSRTLLSNRLEAYINALDTFCHKVDASDKRRKYVSACILDLFLQMLDFLCMSGNLDKAICQIIEFVRASNSPTDTMLLDVYSQLTISDRCIFWFCCVYLNIYRRLPEVVVQQFQFEKELMFGYEWPCAQVANDEKDLALEIMRFAVDKVTLNIDDNSCNKGPTNPRPVHFLAVCHLRCVATLEGFHSFAELLAKYIKMYPDCIELALMSARLQENFKGSVSGGFEEAIRTWPKEVPGIQCLWNQYAEFALKEGRVDFAEKLMTCWYQDFYNVKQDSCARDVEGDNSDAVEFRPRVKNSTTRDDIFRLLNLSLHKILQKSREEALATIDKALKLASPEDFKHCVREHAASVSFNEQRDSKGPGLLVGLLKGYLGGCCSHLNLQPLSRRYYQNIKKPRIRQLIDRLLGPVTMDFCLVNSVLEACYGPSLLPEFERPKDLVDFVEPLMEIALANYPLALSVCKLTSKMFSCMGVASDAIVFWAITLLVNSIFQAVPTAPECIWLEAANVLKSFEILGIAEWFHQAAVSVYPFSLQLWQSYLDTSRKTENVNLTVRLARERGINLEQASE